uniref:Uncharacterized protein n=1 Tax=Panagrolaimus sp. JU765 TaxID=591449 RepID=A0AC34QTW9_9BILA
MLRIFRMKSMMYLVLLLAAAFNSTGAMWPFDSSSSSEEAFPESTTSNNSMPGTTEKESFFSFEILVKAVMETKVVCVLCLIIAAGGLYWKFELPSLTESSVTSVTNEPRKITATKIVTFNEWGALVEETPEYSERLSVLHNKRLEEGASEN